MRYFAAAEDAAGRPEERLTFDYQRTIAQRLGYVTHNGLSDVERFMKHYFLIAKDVGDLTAIVCAALEEKQAKPRAALNRFMGKLRRKPQPPNGRVDAPPSRRPQNSSTPARRTRRQSRRRSSQRR